MRMVKLRPLTESKPFNWLRSNFAQLIKSTRRTRNPKFVPIGCKGTSHPIFYFLFSRSPIGVTREQILTQNGSKHAEWCKDVPFGGLNDGRQHLGVQISQKPSKLGVNMHCRASQLRVNEDCDVIEEWRHWRVAALSTNFRRSLPKRMVIYCQTVVKNAKSLYPSTLTQTHYVRTSVHVFVHKSWNFCSYHIVISILAMLHEIYLKRSVVANKPVGVQMHTITGSSDHYVAVLGATHWKQLGGHCHFGFFSKCQ